MTEPIPSTMFIGLLIGTIVMMGAMFLVLSSMGRMKKAGEAWAEKPKPRAIPVPPLVEGPGQAPAHRDSPVMDVPAGPRVWAELGPVVRVIPSFTEAEFLEEVVALFERVQTTRSQKPVVGHDYVAEQAMAELAQSAREIISIDGVQVGPMRVLSGYADDRWVRFDVEITSIVDEVDANGATPWSRQETWSLQRRADQSQWKLMVVKDIRREPLAVPGPGWDRPDASSAPRPTMVQGRPEQWSEAVKQTDWKAVIQPIAEQLDPAITTGQASEAFTPQGNRWVQWLHRRYASFDRIRRRQVTDVTGAELCFVTPEGTQNAVVVRVDLMVVDKVEEGGEVLEGTDKPLPRTEYWTLMGPPYKLHRIQTEESVHVET